MLLVGCLQVLSVLHESLPDLVGLDVDLATTTAAMEAMASADLLMASGRGGSGSSSWQYVPAPLLTIVGLVRRDTSGIGVMGSAGISLAWPRAQVSGTARSSCLPTLLDLEAAVKRAVKPVRHRLGWVMCVPLVAQLRAALQMNAA